MRINRFVFLNLLVLHAGFEPSVMVPAFLHILISSSLETSRRQIIASVTVRFSGSSSTSLEKYFDRLNGTTEWHHQKLQGMPPRGRLMIAAQQADRLKAQAEQYLNAGQIDIGEPFVRQYLEYKLGQIIARLEIPVPPDYATRGDKRTLSTYIDAITAAVDLYHAAGRCVLSAQQITDLQNHHMPSIMANYVSHYETGAGNPFNANALLGVLQSVDQLANCFRVIDPATNQPGQYYRRLDRQ